MYGLCCIGFSGGGGVGGGDGSVALALVVVAPALLPRLLLVVITIV